MVDMEGEEGETCCEGDVLSVCACIRIPDRGGYRRRKSDTLIMSNDTDEDDETCSLGQICVKWTTLVTIC
ncbi:unnamed protein product [Anisakis simplex]|uniref:Uncharacterized protein n=1 Tax=Anisakis simplex TaxID=6269 RepID=A0A0M3JLA9_ANISI|nr:unnamed protein product [Anisakis simplex]VDK37373.1 unnamed protein product [Anisakis simplex]